MNDSVTGIIGNVGGIASAVGGIAGLAATSSDPENDVSIVSKGQKLSGWTSIKITRGAERIPASFDLQLTTYYPGDNSNVSFIPGAPCQVLIGADPIITGYIDKYTTSISEGQHIIRVTGRSKCQDLVDCSADLPSMQIGPSNALDIATKLATFYGIAVSSDYTGTPVPIPQHNISYGETAAEVIDRVCKASQLLYYDLEDGSLFLTEVGTAFAASGFAEGMNVESATSTFSTDQRYAKYKIMLQQFATSGDYGAINTLGIAADAGARPNRTKIIVSQTGNQQTDLATKIANWECNRRAGRSYTLEVVVDSWRDSAKVLWRPNTICPVNIPSVKVTPNNLIISEINFVRDENGTHAHLTMMPPLAFSVMPNLIIPIPLAELPAKIDVPNTNQNPATPGTPAPDKSPAVTPNADTNQLIPGWQPRSFGDPSIPPAIPGT